MLGSPRNEGVKFPPAVNELEIAKNQAELLYDMLASVDPSTGLQQLPEACCVGG